MADLRTRSQAKVVDLIGEGPIELVGGLKGIYLNKTAVQNDSGTYNFSGVVAAWRGGTVNQSLIEGFSETQNAITVGVELLKDAPITRTITNPDLDGITLTFKVPALVKQNDSGKLKGTSFVYRIEVQSNGGGYSTVMERTISGRADSGFEFAHRINVRGTAAPWDIRCTRLSDDSSITRQSDLIWEYYTEIIDTHTIYPYSAVCALAFDSTQFSSVPSTAYRVRRNDVQVPTNYDPDTRTYASSGPGTTGGLWDGTFKLAFSDNPAWLFYDLLTSRRFGAGRWIDAAQVNKWELYRIAQYCDELVPDGKGGTEPRFTAFLALSTPEEAYNVIVKLATIFRGISYVKEGVIQPAQDRPGETAWQFTAANVIDGKFSYQGTSRKAMHTVAYVTWIDPENFYQQKVEYVEHPDPEMIARYGIVPLETIAVGCKSQGQAHRVGLHALISEALESETVSFSTGLEGATIQPFDIIEISDRKKTAARLGGRIVSASASGIVLDAPVVLEAGASYTCSVIVPDATPPVVTRAVTTAAGEATALQFAAPLDAVPAPGAVWALWSDAAPPRKYRVTARRESEPNVYQITALRHAPEKYAQIEQDLVITAPQQPDRQAPAAVSNLQLVETVTAATRFTGVETNVSLSWDISLLATAYEVQWQADEDNPVIERTQYPMYVIDLADAGTYSVRITPIRTLPDGTELRGQAVSGSGVIIGTDGVPGDITGLVLDATGSVLTITWDAVPEVAVQVGGRIEIRMGDTDWASSTLLLAVPGTATSAQVPAVNGTYRLRAVTANGMTSPHDAVEVYDGDGSGIVVPSKGDVLQSSLDAMDIGMIGIWPSDAVLPLKYLKLDGASYNVDDYPQLGAFYGGSPGGTFAVADWTDVPVWGAGASGEAGTITGDDSRDLTHSHAAGSLAGSTGAVSGLQTGGAATAGDGSITINGDTADALSTIDIKPRRARAWWIQRALK